MKTIDMHERLKRSLAANLVLSDQVDEQEKQIKEKIALNFSLCEFLEKTEEAVIDLVIMLERGCTGTSGLLIQTSDQAAIVKWRKESQELINKVRSKEYECKK